MIRSAHIASILAVIGVPLFGWFIADWSGLTTLVVYWFETLAMCLFVIARIAAHRRWTPLRGHFRYEAPSAERRRTGSSSFLLGFAVTSMVFCGAHGLFLAAVVLVLRNNGTGSVTEVNWRSVGYGALSIALFLALDFLMNLPTLRQWSFADIERAGNQGLGRVVVVHLTLIFGFVGIALTGVSDALFGIFVVLKSLSALSFAVPQWEPAQPPAWLSRVMNRVPNVHPGRRFEEVWAVDRTQEASRRSRNELPWTGGR